MITLVPSETSALVFAAAFASVLRSHPKDAANLKREHRATIRRLLDALITGNDDKLKTKSELKIVANYRAHAEANRRIARRRRKRFNLHDAASKARQQQIRCHKCGASVAEAIEQHARTQLNFWKGKT